MCVHLHMLDSYCSLQLLSSVLFLLSCFEIVLNLWFYLICWCSEEKANLSKHLIHGLSELECFLVLKSQMLPG